MEEAPSLKLLFKECFVGKHHCLRLVLGGTAGEPFLQGEDPFPHGLCFSAPLLSFTRTPCDLEAAGVCDDGKGELKMTKILQLIYMLIIKLESS